MCPVALFHFLLKQKEKNKTQKQNTKTGLKPV